MTREQGKSLSRRDFDAVIRRAAELSSSDPEGADGALTEAELFRIAREVGLADTHVRRALSEVRAGHAGGGIFDRIFGPSLVTASRVVPGPARELASRLDDFFVATQLLQPVRRGPGILQYRPALDWASQLARAASFTSRKYYVASAKSVEIHLNEVEEGRTLVEMVIDPGTRGDNIAGAGIGGGAAGVGIGIGAAASLVAVTPVGLAAGVGILVGAGITSVITYAVGTSHKKKLGEVQAEVEGILDRLELGESLEPPPASWRRWVKRQFHGVARDLMSVEKSMEADLGAWNDEPGHSQKKNGPPRNGEDRLGQ
jgi:hypothetical protein